MAKLLKCLPRFAIWGSVSHSRVTQALLPLQHAINQDCAVHCNRHLPLKFHGNNMSSATAVDTEKIGLLKRLKLRLKKLYSDNTLMAVAAHKIYERTADSIDVHEFFRYFDLPDTFNSWFLVIQLHVWMTVVRTVGERNGRFMRNRLTECMWKDVEARVSKLTEMKSSVRRKSLNSINDQFRAALISYDEGFYNQDTVLAAAVWRTFFSFQYRDPRLLESMVIYIRKQMEHLDTLNTEELMYNGVVSWIPLKDIVHLNKDKI